MYPVLFRLGPIAVQTYTFLLDIGLIAALAWFYFAAPREKAGMWLDAGLAAAVGALLGARLFYVVANGSYYFGHPEEMFMIWTGGLSWSGAALGGLVGGGLYCTRRREPIGPLLDGVAWPLVGLSLLSWGGCLAGGCAYGAQVTPGQAPAWLTMNAPDLYGIWSLRWATQLFGLAWGLLAGGVLALAAKAAWRSGARGLLTLGLVALGAALISLVRGDPDPGFSGNLRLDTAESALVLAAAAVGWAWLARGSDSARAADPPAPALPAAPGDQPQGDDSGDDKV
jgi:phosphatidylglycerol:prolipoprotein diacylglycerol transferase